MLGEVSDDDRDIVYDLALALTRLKSRQEVHTYASLFGCMLLSLHAKCVAQLESVRLLAYPGVVSAVRQKLGSDFT